MRLPFHNRIIRLFFVKDQNIFTPVHNKKNTLNIKITSKKIKTTSFLFRSILLLIKLHQIHGR